MSQTGYQSYPAYEPGETYFNGSIDPAARSFDARTGTQQAAVKQLQPAIQGILDGPHDARHSIPPRPFDTYTYPGYEASFHATSSSIDQNLQVLLSGHRPYASSRDTSGAYSNPIASFYNDADGPWNSLRATSQARSSAPAAAVTMSMPNLDYPSYRDAPASEISDSGYASQAAASQSIVNTEPTDYSRECGDLPVQENNFSFTAASSSSSPYDLQSLATRNADEPDSRSALRPRPGQSPLLCTRCGETSKCPSDFKKHQLKHDKPWKCDQPDCSRKDGFTTVNDLNRHKKSVHKIASTTKSYRCVADRCKNKDKLWPRLDNFKQHIQRMHKDQDEQDLIKRSQTFGTLAPAASFLARADSTSQMNKTLAGIDSKRGDLDIAHPNRATEPALDQDKNNESSADLIADLKTSFLPGYQEPREWNQSQSKTYSGGSVRSAQLSEDHKSAQNGHPDAPKLRELADAATARHAGSRNGSRSGSSKKHSAKRASEADHPEKRMLVDFCDRLTLSITNNPNNESLDKAVLRAVMENSENLNIITPASDPNDSIATINWNAKNADRPPPGSEGLNGTETTMSTAEVRKSLAAASKDMRNVVVIRDDKANGRNDKSHGVRCKHCGKLLPRNCDLNKHEKRHTRPYGCTFSKCFKMFGSKSDWKRHEETLHYHYEMWRCECPRLPSAETDTTAADVSNTKAAVCAEVFWDVPGFSCHLRDTHGLASAAIETEVQIRKLNRNIQYRFWCGFCQAIVPLKQVIGKRAWDERFNHIDGHFKLGLRTLDWLDVETNKFKKDMEREGKKDDLRDDATVTSAESECSTDAAPTEGERIDGDGPMRRAAEKAGASLVILAAMKHGGTKRVREASEGEGEDSGEVDATGQPRRKRRRGETLFFCCGCNQGPFAWSLYQSCLHCEHEFCERCDRRKHERSAEEESVDYNIWHHVIGTGL